MKLRRVELSATHLFASNYLKTYRYSFEDIAGVKSLHFGLFELLRVKLKSKGKLGKNISFILNRAQLEYYLEKNTDSEFTLVQDSQSDK